MISLFSCSGYRPFVKQKSNGQLILNGRVKKTDLVAANGCLWYASAFDSYVPLSDFIERLKAEANEMKVLVVAGTWCSDTQRELPRFMKVASLAGIPDENIEIVMVDRKKEALNLNVRVLQVTNVPTFIIYRAGKEQGRIVEQAGKSIEQDLTEIWFR